MESISLWSAIAQMKNHTSNSIPFSFEHYTWDSHRNKASGLRVVEKAILRPAARSDDLDNADHKLFYKDLSILDPRHNCRVCWQILITKFNGIPITTKQPFYEDI